jgi:uncharacterized protein YprB with RNaseH-like and TPR domain
MTLPATRPSDDLARRLERFRAGRLDRGRPDGLLPHRPIGSAELADRLATTLEGEVIQGPTGRFVRIEREAVTIAVDRDRLASLPGQPQPDRPLVCLDTETTGLATAAGTVAFCVGLGWWHGMSFRQVQLLLPDHSDEAALLEELGRHIPPNAWLVTYNGRGFDWPLLVARYRLARRDAPMHDGHLDLLPIVRRLFRHRMPDARLRTAEEFLLGMVRHDDVDGWEIPARYLGFLRGGPAHPLLAVVRHNHEDVRSLARIIALLDADYASSDARRSVPAGDLAGLARAFVRIRRPEDALACLEEALERDRSSGSRSPVGLGGRRSTTQSTPWWSPHTVADFGGPPRPANSDALAARRAAFDVPWDMERIAVDRAHLLRRLGRHGASEEAWTALTAGPGRTPVLAWIEVAKLREHRLGDRAGALAAAQAGLMAAERRRSSGMPEPRMEADLLRRIARLRRPRGSARRRIRPHLGPFAHDEPTHPLTDRARANGRQVRHAGETDALHGKGSSSGGEPEVRAQAASQQPGQGRS